MKFSDLLQDVLLRTHGDLYEARARLEASAAWCEPEKRRAYKDAHKRFQRLLRWKGERILRSISRTAREHPERLQWHVRESIPDDECAMPGCENRRAPGKYRCVQHMNDIEG